MSEDNASDNGWLGYGLGFIGGLAAVAITTDISGRLDQLQKVLNLEHTLNRDMECPAHDHIEEIHHILLEHNKGIENTAGALVALADRVGVNSADVNVLSNTLADHFGRKSEPQFCTVTDPQGGSKQVIVESRGEDGFEAVCPSLDLRAKGYTPSEAVTNLAWIVTEERTRKEIPKKDEKGKKD